MFIEVINNGMFSLVLVCLDNFQEYILDNISQLIRLGHTKIYIITNNHLFHYFEQYKNVIKLVSVESLPDPYHFQQRSKLDRNFRKGFWHLTSARFFVLHAFMKEYSVERVIHLENDVLIYYNCDDILTMSLLDKEEIYIPFDSYSRSISSIIYIPDADIFGKVLEEYDIEKNDMYNFKNAREKGWVRGFPIWISDQDESDERKYVSEEADNFYGFIFDAAAIGQYIGGVDPRNIEGDTRGFINEVCVIQYGKEGKIEWKQTESGISRPFFLRNTRETRETKDREISIPIFNLHIHSKNLKLYM
jgi:hypothetical protein